MAALSGAGAGLAFPGRASQRELTDAEIEAEAARAKGFEDVEVSRVYRSEPDAAAAYDKMAASYDTFGSYEKEYRDEAIEVFAASEGEVVLEIGCGTGHCAVALAEGVGESGHVHGLDLSEQMCAITTTRITEHGYSDRFTAHNTSALTLPLDDGVLDGVFTTFTLELFDTPLIPIVLEEVMRVLRPGGRFVVAGMSKKRRSVMMNIYEWAHEWFPGTVDCRPIFIEAELVRGGFDIVSAKDMPMWGLAVEVVLGVKPATSSGVSGGSSSVGVTLN